MHQPTMKGKTKHHRFIVCLACGLLLLQAITAQDITQKIKEAYSRFENDPQLKHAIASLLVIDAATGKTVFSKNAGIGLVPASTQKIITSAAAFELLGKNFQYQTGFAWNASQKTITILPSGDPTLGSERWPGTQPSQLLGRLLKALPAGANNIDLIAVDGSAWEKPSLPYGWIWQDLGNYYGAAPAKLNWRENQFDIYLKSGNRIGDSVRITGTRPVLSPDFFLNSQLTSATRGTGDNAYVYFPITGNEAVIKGTIPVNENRFVISGALPSGSKQLLFEIKDTLLTGKAISVNSTSTETTTPDKPGPPGNVFYTELSPPLDSIVFWFNRKSINLYGEALMQTIAFQKRGYGSVDTGIVIVKDFWKSKGVEPLELNMADGSGLSPLNRVTTHAQVAILQYARKQPWFSSYYLSLPEYNGIKMKSGTIKDVKGFCGYHTATSGRTYIFSFLVNNYNGQHAALVRKMYTVLNTLK